MIPESERLLCTTIITLIITVFNSGKSDYTAESAQLAKLYFDFALTQAFFERVLLQSREFSFRV